MKDGPSSTAIKVMGVMVRKWMRETVVGRATVVEMLAEGKTEAQVAKTIADLIKKGWFLIECDGDPLADEGFTVSILPNRARMALPWGMS